MLFFAIMIHNVLFAQTIQVQQLNPEYNVQVLGGKNIQVRHAKEIEKLPEQTVLIPSKSEVETALKNAGLETEIGTLDRLDRDQLYLRAKKFNLIEMMNFYPQLPKVKIEKLINLINSKRVNGSKK